MPAKATLAGSVTRPTTEKALASSLFCRPRDLTRRLPGFLSLSSTIAFACCAPLLVGAWGEPHKAITQAALAALTDAERAQLGAELGPLGTQHCLIPDRVYEGKEVAKYAMMDSHPGVTYLVKLHLPALQPENYETLRFFMGRSVAAFQAGNLGDAARYAGTVAHALEDWSCPAHVVPGDNMFTLFQQFLPPPDALRNKLLHSPIEGGKFDVTIGDFKPTLLGATVDEAAFNLLQRLNAATILARAQTIPIIQALYAGDTNAVTAAQLKAATKGATVVADALHTLLCLGAQQLDAGALAQLNTVDLSKCCPLEATNLFFAQATFFSKPYWGHAHVGGVLEGGSNAVPIKLRVTENGGVVVKDFASGIGTGTRSALTYLVPTGVYRQFTVLAGLHPELGAKGGVEFVIFGNDKKLASVALTGDQPAHRFDCALAGVTNLQLVATAKGGDPKANYAIWAEPRLVK